MTDQDLQFDRAETPSASPGGATCVVCKQPILVQYYSAHGRPVCAGCRNAVAEQLSRPAGNLPKGILFGIGGAIAGAAVYFGVAAITGAEIALVAIAVGWLVGRAVQLGSGGAGGPPQQVIAATLTYLSLDAAYLAMIVRSRVQGLGVEVADAISAALRGPPSRWLTLPITDNLSQLPWGAIGLLIVVIGISQAWRMNKAVTVQFEGPFPIQPPPADPS